MFRYDDIVVGDRQKKKSPFGDLLYLVINYCVPSVDDPVDFYISNVVTVFVVATPGHNMVEQAAQGQVVKIFGGRDFVFHCVSYR